MPISFQELADARRSVKFRFLKHDVNITYRLGVMTADFLAQLQERAKAADSDDQEAFGIVATMLEDVIERWDVLGADNEPLPTTAETFRKLPSSFVMAIVTAIQDDNNPKALR